jgi:hypothetical protein
MKISNPKAKYGDVVEVLNYRCKPSKWCQGECRGVAYKNGFGGGFSWHYDVYVRSGKGFYLYVGDERIKKTNR